MKHRIRNLFAPQTVIEYAAGLCLVQICDQLYQRTFAAAGGAYQGDHLAGLYIQGHMIHCQAIPGIITETQILNGDTAAQFIRFLVFVQRDLFRGFSFQNILSTLNIGAHTLEGGNHIHTAG